MGGGMGDMRGRSGNGMGGDSQVMFMDGDGGNGNGGGGGMPVPAFDPARFVKQRHTKKTSRNPEKVS